MCPCFLAGVSEDHDFDEIKKIVSNNNEYSWNIDNKSAVGNLSTGTLVDILNSIKNDLCKNKYGEDLYGIFENAYTKNNGFTFLPQVQLLDHCFLIMK